MRKFIIAVITCLLFLVPVAAMATDWDGNGSDSIEACEDGQVSYLHWVFTGGDGEDTVTLTVNGDTYQMEQKGKSGKGAWHATTPFYDPDNTTASTDADGGVLTISDGCTGEVRVQPSPTPTEPETPSETPSESESPKPSETPSESETPTPNETPSSSESPSPEPSESEDVVDCKIDERSARGFCPDEPGHEEEIPSVTDTPTPSDTDSEVPPVTPEAPTEEISERTELPHTGIEEWLLGIGTALMVLGGVSLDLTRQFA